MARPQLQLRLTPGSAYLLKREENLQNERRFRLRDLLRYNMRTVRAYLLKEAFHQLRDYHSPAWAAKFLDEWCRQTMQIGNPICFTAAGLVSLVAWSATRPPPAVYPSRRKDARFALAPVVSQTGYRHR